MAMRFLITGGDALVARANLRGATPRPGAYSPPPMCGHHLAPLSAYSLGEDPHEAPAAGTQQARSALASLSFTHAQQGLTVLNDSDVVTRRPFEGGGGTVIDLLLVSAALSDMSIESTLDVSFSEATFSDHALLSFALPLEGILIPTFQANRLPRSLFNKWCFEVSYIADFMTLFNVSTTEALDRSAAALQDYCIQFMKHVQPKSHPPSLTGAAWWNEACTQHMTTLRQSRGAARGALQQMTRGILRTAKRDYYTKICESASPDNIWKLAKWGSGTRSTPVPPLRGPDGLASTPQHRAELFATTFFPEPPPRAPGAERPLPTGTTPFPPAPLTIEEVQAALASVSPTSAPGPSGVTWPMVKHIVHIAPQGMLRLLQACLDLGHQPPHGGPLA